ncbi:membrane protein insertase YidC [Metamycoplasma equirhinis]|uniref:membrane protein insertase YidC n=1 Tax=Metamycoplasma equirhinis TaxID=92402 RepID=UPI003593319E
MANNDFSKHYSDFRANRPEDKSPKMIWKKVWKWVKIVLVIVFMTIGLVGCIQSTAVKSSPKVGSGQELYTKKEKISPNIVSLRYNEISKSFVLANQGKTVVANTYLSLKEPEIIKKLQAQDKNYGKYNGRSFALQLQKELSQKVNNDKNDEKNWGNINGDNGKVVADKNFVYSRGDNYAYLNLGDANGNGATTNYKPLTVFSEILIPDSIKFKNNAQKKHDYTALLNVGYEKILGRISASKTPYEAMLRDLLQILIEETLLIWNKELRFGNKAFHEIIGASANSSAQELIEKWNAYLKSFLTKVGTPINEKDGQLFLTITTIFTTTIKQYLLITNYEKTGYKITENGGERSVYFFSSITPGGNYDRNSWIGKVFSENELVPQKPITTYKEFWQQGPFYGMFVFPIHRFMTAIMSGLGATGWAVILALIVTVIIVRLITFAISFKSLFSQAKMDEFNQKKAKIEAKYAAYKGDKQMMQRKQMEIQELYKKEKISPWGQMVSLFITLPILIVVFRIISTSPEIKQATWYGIQLSATSMTRVFSNKEYIYLPIIIFSLGMQALAQYMPKILKYKRKKSLRADAYQQEAMKKERRKFNIISLVFIGFGVLFSAGLQIYWIFGAIWTILQHVFVHYFQKTKFFKTKVEPKLA